MVEVGLGVGVGRGPGGYKKVGNGVGVAVLVGKGTGVTRIGVGLIIGPEGPGLGGFTNGAKVGDGLGVGVGELTGFGACVAP